MSEFYFIDKLCSCWECEWVVIALYCELCVPALLCIIVWVLNFMMIFHQIRPNIGAWEIRQHSTWNYLSQRFQFFQLNQYKWFESWNQLEILRWQALQHSLNLTTVSWDREHFKHQYSSCSCFSWRFARAELVNKIKLCELDERTLLLLCCETDWRESWIFK